MSMRRRSRLFQMPEKRSTGTMYASLHSLHHRAIADRAQTNSPPLSTIYHYDKTSSSVMSHARKLFAFFVISLHYIQLNYSNIRCVLTILYLGQIGKEADFTWQRLITKKLTGVTVSHWRSQDPQVERALKRVGCEEGSRDDTSSIFVIVKILFFRCILALF